ncbi:transmembrane domain-containing protein [Cryptosporidium canis]|uniref:Transmembrane domain-containing protein n=1 Tax=Cryptosporidium canis TaxID=195482 RepID=A0ABQ8PCR7_9CRYT|nr:transmembrane domain-containing protein [Cryptosporidium canis]KAJ1615512.1 transmembrane domain-containing protein [Cryptosporidium canis]
MEITRDDIIFKKEECWKESEKKFLQNEWRNSKESLESLVSSGSLDNSAFAICSKISQESNSDEYSVMIDDEMSVDEVAYFQFSKISIINRVFCDISSVKYTTYAEVKHIFYFLSIFFLIMSLILFERSWNGVARVRIDYDNYGEFPLLFNNSCYLNQGHYQNENSSDNNTVYEFTLDRTLHEPIFVYYGLSGFFSNTRDFVGSKPPEIFGYGYRCTHIFSIEDILRYRPDFRAHLAEFFRVPMNFNFTKIDNIFSKNSKQSRIFNIRRKNSPVTRNILCGLPIYSVFTDEFELIRKGNGREKIHINPIDFPEDQWKYKILHNFRQFVYGKIARNIDHRLDEKGKNLNDKIPKLSIMLSKWWNQSISPNFIKPYGVITSSYEYGSIDDLVLYPGSYELNLTSNLFPSNAWGTDKYVLLMTLSIFGGEQYLAATICLFISIMYAIIIYFNPNRTQVIIIRNNIDHNI